MRSLPSRPSHLGWLIGASGSKPGSCRVRTLDHANAWKCLKSSSVRAVDPSPLPQLWSYRERIDAGGFPPRDLVAVTMEGPMMASTQRHGVFVTDPPAKGARLSEPQMMGVRRPSPADEARLRRHEPQVRAVTIAARFAQYEGALVDMPCDCIVDLGWQRELTRRAF
jgi:hypothetical protein